MIPSPHANPKTEPQKPRERWSKAKGDIPVVLVGSGHTGTADPLLIQSIIEANKGKQATITIKREAIKTAVDFPVILGPQHVIMARKGTITHIELKQ